MIPPCSCSTPGKKPGTSTSVKRGILNASQNLTNLEAFIDELISTVQSGGVVVNDVMMHCGNNGLPFGGIGNSGAGFYHGRFSYECFSHKRAVLRRDDHTVLDVPFRYPPYHDFGLKFFQFAAQYIPSQPAVPSSTLAGAVIVASVVWYFGNNYT